MRLLIIAIFFVGCFNIIANKQLKLVAEWKQLDFVFPNEQIRNAAIQNGEFIATNAVPIDTDTDYKAQKGTRVFVTIPRFNSGIPITLGTISTQMGINGPLIEPYPSYQWHMNPGTNCNGITSVYRIAIDKCQRLWVLDTGSIENIQRCPPQLLIFDLNTDNLIHQYKFPNDQFIPGASLFITPIVDVRDAPPLGSCGRTMVYIADVSGFAIIVYDLQMNRSWRTHNKLDFPHPHSGTFNLANETFDLMDGVFGMAISLPQNTGRRDERSLYFHSLASITENAVPLYVMDNATAWLDNPDYNPRAFKEIGSRGAQSTAEAIDRNGNLFFGLINPIGIGCWDSNKSYTRNNIKVVIENEQTLQFVSGLKIVQNKQDKDELWALSCRFQRIMTGSLNFNEVNFRIQALAVGDLLDGSNRCDVNRVVDNSAITFEAN